jgi:hypothetical protein
VLDAPSRHPSDLRLTAALDQLDLAQPVGSLYDVLRGGCVTYDFNFDRERYALIGQFESAVGLYSRQQFRLILKKKLGLELNP